MLLSSRPSFYLFAACVLLGLASGCNAKLVGGADGKPGLSRAREADRVVTGLADNAFTTEYFEGNARVKLASPKLNIGGSATVRLHRDKAIWMVVKKFGFEGARVLIQPDSFFYYNRLNNEYVAEPLSYIERKYKIPARFDWLQEIILGNAVFPTRDLDLETIGEDFILTGRDSRYATRHTVDGRGFRLTEMSLNEMAQDRTLTIGNADFRSVGGADDRTFAHQRRIAVRSQATGDASMDMEFSRIKLSGPLAMPFRRR